MTTPTDDDTSPPEVTYYFDDDGLLLSWPTGAMQPPAADGVTWWPLTITEAKTMMSALIMGLGDHGDMVDDGYAIADMIPADFHD